MSRLSLLWEEDTYSIKHYLEFREIQIVSTVQCAPLTNKFILGLYQTWETIYKISPSLILSYKQCYELMEDSHAFNYKLRDVVNMKGRIFDIPFETKRLTKGAMIFGDKAIIISPI